MKDDSKRTTNLPIQKRNLKERKEGDNSFVPFSIKLEGSVVESLSRILQAICRLIEEFVELAIFWLQKKRFR